MRRSIKQWENVILLEQLKRSETDTMFLIEDGKHDVIELYKILKTCVDRLKETNFGPLTSKVIFRAETVLYGAPGTADKTMLPDVQCDGCNHHPLSCTCDVPEPEDYCAGCGYLKCRCDEPHKFTPNSDGFCTWCGSDDADKSAHTKLDGVPVPIPTITSGIHEPVRQNDEYWCSKCRKRWDVDDDEPECV